MWKSRINNTGMDEKWKAAIFMTNKRMHKMKWASFPPKKILTFGQNFLNPQVDF
jgi:hypothetical protein